MNPRPSHGSSLRYHCATQAPLDFFRSKDFEFNALCFQECWLSKTDQTNHIQLDGYNCIYQSKSCSGKRGLFIYLQKRFQHKIRKSINTSNIWEGVFIDVKNGGLKKTTLTLGNIYRPPRDLNEKYECFNEDFAKILNELSKGNQESVIVGDFNINLLKVMEREAFSKSYDAITTNCFIPTITFPTRFSTLNGSNIENILCKLFETSLTSTSGIFIDQFSDHLPCFISLDLMSQKHNYDKLDHNSNDDPNENYNILETTIKSAIDEAILSKKIRFNKYKHRKSPCITNGILKSIKYRENSYEVLIRFC